jgi:hypothetical protein
LPKRWRPPDHHYSALYVGVGEPWRAVLRDALGDLTGKIPADDVWRMVDKPRGIAVRNSNDHRRLREAMGELGWERRKLRFRISSFAASSVIPAFVRGATAAERLVEIYALVNPVTGHMEIFRLGPDGDPEPPERVLTVKGTRPKERRKQRKRL